LSGETVQDRQRERRGLAGSGLRNPDHVAARHDCRDSLRLDWRRIYVFFLGERSCDCFVELEVMKVGQRKSFLFCTSARLSVIRHSRRCGRNKTARAIWVVDEWERASQKPFNGD
jgi:hypothetical protein